MKWIVESVVGLVSAIFAKLFPDLGTAGPVFQAIEVVVFLLFYVTHLVSNQLVADYINVSVLNIRGLNDTFAEWVSLSSTTFYSYSRLREP